jgi:DNA-binding NarL/FixJ family response regulator
MKLNNTVSSPSVIIADNQALHRKGIITYLQHHTSCHIAAETNNGAELIRLSQQLLPDIVITDIWLPGKDGVEATVAILKHNESCSIIAMSVIDSEYAIIDMLAAGAKAYIHKSSDPNELLKAVEHVMKGKYYFSADGKPDLIRKISERKYNPVTVKKEVELTSRELQIIRMLCCEKNPTEIGDALRISKRTVDVHLQHIYRKTGVTNMIGLLVYAIRNAIVYIPRRR